MNFFQVPHRQFSRKSILLLCCYSLQVPLDLPHWVSLPFPASHYWDHQQQQPCANTPPWGAPRDWGSLKSHRNRTAELKIANKFRCSQDLECRLGLGTGDYLQHVPPPCRLHDPWCCLHPHHPLSACRACSLKVSLASKGGDDLNSFAKKPIQPWSGGQTGKSST